MLLKPTSSISSQYGFRIIERLTQGIPRSGWRLRVLAHRTTDVSDAPEMLRWSPDRVDDIPSGTSWSVGVSYSFFSSSMSWNIAAGRAGGVPAEGDTADHVTFYRGNKDTSESTKSEVMVRYPKPTARKSYSLPCGVMFVED
jgi:hypothetical protein